MASNKGGGRRPLDPSIAKNRGAQLKALRLRLGWSQETVADRSSGKLVRTDVVRIESGDNASSTSRVLMGLAKAFDSTSDDINAYLSGELAIEGVAAGVRERGAPKHATAAGQDGNDAVAVEQILSGLRTMIRQEVERQLADKKR